MRTWQDANDRAWPLDLTIPVIEAMNAAAGRNLLDVWTGHVLDALVADMGLFGRVMAAAFAVAEADREAFFRGLRGAAMWRAHDLVWDNLADFMPPEQAAALFDFLAKKRALMAEVSERYRQDVAALTTERFLELAKGTDQKPAGRKGRKGK